MQGPTERGGELLLDLQNPAEQLPSPSLFVGDFNAHSPAKDCHRTSSAVRKSEGLLLNTALPFWNISASTYFNVGSGIFSAIDLSVCSPSLAPRLSRWVSFIKMFSLSARKTTCAHFCRKRRRHPDPMLTIYGVRLQYIKEIKILVLTFDRHFKRKIWLLGENHN